MKTLESPGIRGRGSSFQAAVHVVQMLLLIAAALFYCLHFLHLGADFPNYSPWMDWAKYTDEGWYGDAAIRHFQRGGWYVAGDFNPAAALPVWPLVEAVVFRFSGVGIVPARALTVAVFGLTLLCAFFLLRRWTRGARRAASLAPEAAVLLLAVSPFCYAFTRLAIIEPLLVLLTLAALLTASAVGGDASSRRSYWPALVLGVLLPLLILTKTTAVFLFPSILWMVWARVGYRWRPLLREGAIIGGLGSALWLLYFGLIVRPHFLSDYRYFFSANAYAAITAANFPQVFVTMLQDGMWMGPVLFPLALVLGLASLLRWRILLRNPLTGSLLLWVAGYAAFLVYHNNLQPRYYLVVAVPLTLLVPLVLDGIWHATRGTVGQAPVVALAGVLMVVAVTDARKMVAFVRAPEYTFVNAAERVRSIVAADHTHNPLLLSISGSDLSLMTGLPSICDDFGTMELERRVATYRPGWYVSWNHVEDDKMDALTPMYHLERIAEFPAMDDPDRNLLILYRLDPAVGLRSPRHPRRPVPKLLTTRMGQQPSVTQQEH